MKKGISQRKVQRMRNLATKNYGAKTTIQSGYNKKSSKKSEGDVWEEKGKTWTIKNGIKQSITKLDSARTHMRMPTHCPKCNTRMRNSAHKFMYVRFKHCLHCQTKFEFKLEDDGKYNDWKNDRLNNNFSKWLNTIEGEFDEFMKSRKSQKQITESGHIEDWSGGQTDEQIIEQFNKFIETEKQKLKKHLGE